MQPFPRPRYQQFALWLAVAAVLLRALIPDGFMPEHRAGQRGPTLVLCSAGSLAVLKSSRALAAGSGFGDRLGASHLPGDSGHHSAASHPGCAFASAAAPGLPVALGFMPWLRHAGAAPVALLDFIAVSAADHLRPPLRGPPRSS